MTIAAHLIADSVNPTGDRLTTWVLKYPRAIHSEVMTHRAFSRNSASSRAIPISKMIQRVVDEPFVPHMWGKAQAGMQSDDEVDEATQRRAERLWLKARDAVLEVVRGDSPDGNLLELGLHKQVVNRLLEPWMHIEVVVSATEWRNWFLLRDDHAAEPHIRELAHTMRELYLASQPAAKRSVPHACCMSADEVIAASDAGAWHLPFSEACDGDLLRRIKEAIAHAAWVSYLNEWREGYTEEDIERVYSRLLSAQPIHASPAEHVAMACDGPHRHGNFTGWYQWRKFLPGESGGDYR